MESIDRNELSRRMGYWNNALEKLENRMVKEQVEHADVENRPVHLHELERQHLNIKSRLVHLEHLL